MPLRMVLDGLSLEYATPPEATGVQASDNTFPEDSARCAATQGVDAQACLFVLLSLDGKQFPFKCLAPGTGHDSSCTLLIDARLSLRYTRIERGGERERERDRARFIISRDNVLLCIVGVSLYGHGGHINLQCVYFLPFHAALEGSSVPSTVFKSGRLLVSVWHMCV